MKNIKKKLISILLDTLNFLFAFFTVALVIIALFRPDMMDAFLNWVKVNIELIGNWNYAILFSSSIIESFPVLGVVVPGQNIMLAVGGFFGKNNLIPVIIVTIFGALIGNYLGFILGVKYGDGFFKKYGDWFGIGKTELKIFKKQIEKNGAWFIIFGKFHNFTRAFIPFIAGSMGMKHKNFWIYNLIGSVIWSISIISLGVVFVQFYKNILKYFPYLLGFLLIILALYIFFFKKNEFMDYLKDKNQEINEKIANKM
ncbi:MAG: DedA family protein [Candidatus Gracilibacteria bacterium]|nr:DedA family protein [Candidatus Gracilibacteria bacterium]